MRAVKLLASMVTLVTLTGCSYLEKHDNAYLDRGDRIKPMHFSRAVRGEVKPAFKLPKDPIDNDKPMPSLYPPGNEEK